MLFSLLVTIRGAPSYSCGRSGETWYVNVHLNHTPQSKLLLKISLSANTFSRHFFLKSLTAMGGECKV